MKRGYIRVSTKNQSFGTSLEEQKAWLEKEGCEIFYEDVASGGKMERPGFQKLCAELQHGDTLMVCKMDRIARTAGEAYEMILSWTRAGIRVHILNMGLIEDTAIGRVILRMLLSFAEFERDQIIERCQGGRAYKRATDKTYKEGRPLKYKEAQRNLAMDLLETHSHKEVARMLGMSRSTVLREAKRRGITKNGVSDQAGGHHAEI